MKPKLNKLVVAEFVAALRQVRAGTTCRHYEAVLSKWARWADERKQKHPVSREQWEDYWRTETSHFSGVSSWDTAIAAHKLFWRWLGVNSPVTVRFRPRRVRNQRRLLSDNSLKLLLAPENFETTAQECIRLALRIMAASGCRISEACALKLTDIDWQNKTATVTVKRGATGMLHFDGDTVAEIQAWLRSRKRRRPDSPLNVLLTQRGTAYEPNNLRKAIQARAGRRGVIDFTPHDLRHRFATTLVANGVPLTTVQRLMNHKSIGATAIYVRTTAGEARTAHKALNLPKATECTDLSETTLPYKSNTSAKMQRISRIVKDRAISAGGASAARENAASCPAPPQAARDLPAQTKSFVPLPKGAGGASPGCPPSTDAPVFFNAPVSNWRTE